MTKLSINDCQKAELKILTKIDAICKELNLRYYLFYGTLIGAIRHHGFIPWDDDLDIMMPRPDYTKFIDYFENNQTLLFPLKAVYVWHKSKYSYAMTRITDISYKLNFTEDGPFSKEDMGLFVDVYPYDGAGQDTDKAIILGKKSISAEHWIKRAHDDFYTPTNNAIKKMMQPLIYSLAHHIGEEHYQKKLKKISSVFEYDNSKYVAPLTWHEGIAYFPRSWFEPSIEVEFCNHNFRAPKEYDEILKQGYGDYMQLPPENDRVATHFYDAYIRSEWNKEKDIDNNFARENK